MVELSRGLLDTSVLIAGDDDPELSLKLPPQVAISVATLAELHFGVLVAKDESSHQVRLRRLGMVEASIQPIAIDAAVARAFATVAQAVKTAGRQPRSRMMDLWIAATALTLGVPLFTRNPLDFAGLEGLVDVRSV